MRMGVKEKTILISIFAGIFLLTSTPSFAESEYHATGIVFFAENPLGEVISIGDPYEFQLFYPDNPIDIAFEDSFLGVYPNSTLSFNLNNIINASSTGCKIMISQNRTLTDPDSVSFSCENPPFNPGPIGDADFNSISVFMTDSDGLALTSDTLPKNLTALDSFWDFQSLILTYNTTITVEEEEIPITVSITGTFTFSGDTDGDGILDFWEINGFDYDLDGNDEIDFPKLEANFTHKDLFLEIDYMSMHKPNNQTITDVVNAFANAPNNLVSNPDGQDGINLHILVDDSIVHQNNITMWSGFDSLKTANFGTDDERLDDKKIKAKKLFYRYGMFIHNMNGTGSSGRGELPGNDFVVSLGGNWGKDGSNHSVGTLDEQAGTLMHEFGHTLNLRHGGQTDFNCKPNYLSIMSYTFQFPDNIPGRPLDYSREKNPTLVEGNLDETKGVTGPFGRQTVIGADMIPYHRTQVGAAFDFDSNGNATDIGVSRNINFLGGGCDGFGTVLVGYSDWDKILNEFRSTENFADGVHPELTDEIDEMTREQVDAMVANIYPFLCQVPEDGNWNVTSSCELTLNATSPANVSIQSNSVLTIPANLTLTIPSGSNITIEHGSGVLIKDDGTLQIVS